MRRNGKKEKKKASGNKQRQKEGNFNKGLKSQESISIVAD